MYGTIAWLFVVILQSGQGSHVSIYKISSSATATTAAAATIAAAAAASAATAIPVSGLLFILLS